MRDNDPKHTATVCKDYLQHLEQSDELCIKNNALPPSIPQSEPNREDLEWIRSENP